MVTESVATALESSRRRIILCADVGAAALILERHPLSLILTNVQMPQP